MAWSVRIALLSALLLLSGCGSSEETPATGGAAGMMPDASADGASGSGGKAGGGGAGGGVGGGGGIGGGGGVGGGGAGAGGSSAGAAGSGHIGLPLPEHVKGHLAEGAAMAVYEHKGYVYLATGALVRAYPVKLDLTWNAAPVSEIYTRSLVLDLTVTDDVLYIAARSALLLVDISNPLSPTLLGSFAKDASYPYNTEFNAIRVVGSRAYVSGNSLGLLILDVSNKASPTQLGIWSPPIKQTYARAVDVAGDFAYVGVNDKLHVVNVSNPAAPTSSGEFTASAAIADIAAASNDQVFATEYHCGLYALDVSNKAAPAQVGFLGNHDATAADAINANNVLLRGNRAFVSVRYQGFDIIDVADPAHLSIVGKGTGYEGYNEGIATTDEITFVTASTYGMAVYDSKTPTAPTKTSDVPVVGEIFGMHLRGSYLYLAVRNGGVWTADVSDTTHPRIVDFQRVSGRYFSTTSQGDYLYVTGAWGGLNVFSLANPAQPALVVEDFGEGATQVPGINMIAEGNTLYFASDNQLNQVDITDPTHPAVTKSLPLTGWGMASKGDYLYVSTTDALVVIQRSTFTLANQIAGSFLYAPIAISGNTLVVGGSNHIVSYDLADPAAPGLGKELKYPGQWSPAGAVMDGTRLWATGNRVKVFEVPTPAGINEVSSISFESSTGHVLLGPSELLVSGEDTGVYMMEKL